MVLRLLTENQRKTNVQLRYNLPTTKLTQNPTPNLTYNQRGIRTIITQLGPGAPGGTGLSPPESTAGGTSEEPSADRSDHSALDQ